MCYFASIIRKMFRKIDQYIIKKYLVTFFYTMMLITMIAITIDFFEKVDKLLTKEVSLYEVFAVYYLNFIPWINGLLWPLFALLSVIFFTSRLAGDSEFVAMLSAGITYQRILFPYFIGGTILASLLWFGNNYLIPNSSRIKNEFESQYIRKSNKQTLSTDVHFFTSPSELIYFRIFNTRDSSARMFRLERFKGNELVYMLKTSNLKYEAATNKWSMTDFEEHTFDSLKESLVIQKEIKRDTTFPFVPDDFVRYTKQMEMMTTGDLRRFIGSEQNKGIETAKKYIIELYRRTADPFTIIILTLMGVSIASRKVRGGMGLHLAAGVIVGATFVILSKFSVTFATNMALPAGLAVWIPNIFFSVVAILLYRRAQK
ncbi:MAG: LptF/LptG family permease [Cyclobacteriaceae bacterium]